MNGMLHPSGEGRLGRTPALAALAVLVALSGLLGAVSCVSVPESGVAGVAATPPTEWPRSPELEKLWGPPVPFGKLERIHGKPGVGYRDPQNRSRYVDIIWEDPEQPKEIQTAEGKRASDGNLVILGQSVDFYFSGNEASEISTQPIQLTTPSGRKVWYSFVFSAQEHQDGRNIPVFVW